MDLKQNEKKADLRAREREELEIRINESAVKWKKSGEDFYRGKIIEDAFKLYGEHYRHWRNLKDYPEETKENGFREALSYIFKNFDADRGSFVGLLRWKLLRSINTEYAKERVEKDPVQYQKEMEDYEKEREIYRQAGKSDEQFEQEVKKPNKYKTQVSLNAKLGEDGATEYMEMLPDETNPNIEDDYVDRDTAKETTRIIMADRAARIINFTEKNYGKRTANPTRRLWYRIYYTEFITFIAKFAEEHGAVFSDKLHERDIFQAMRTNIVECDMQEATGTYLEYFMSNSCYTLNDIGKTDMKFYQELENFKEHFDISKENKRIEMPLEGEKAGKMSQDISVGYLKNYGKTASESGASNFRTEYEKYIGIS